MTKLLHLEIVGKGTPLVLLHGWGWNSTIWQPIIQQLAENFQLFLLDLPGFGKSPVITENYRIEEISELLLETTPAESIWLGWSLGGMIAWYIALHHPERVTRLITVSSSPKWLNTSTWPGVSADLLNQFSSLLVTNYQKTLQDFLELQLRGTAKRSELLARLQPEITMSPPHMAALTGGLNILRDLDLRKKLNHLVCPSLHIFGAHDTLVPISVVERIKLLHPEGKYQIIKRAGHMPFLSESELFLELVREFCIR